MGDSKYFKLMGICDASEKPFANISSTDRCVCDAIKDDDNKRYAKPSVMAVLTADTERAHIADHPKGESNIDIDYEGNRSRWQCLGRRYRAGKLGI